MNDKRRTLGRRSLAIFIASLGCAWLGIRWGNDQQVPSRLSSSLTDALLDCPDRPNCVSTSSSRTANKIAPIELGEAASEARAKLEDIIAQMPRSRIIVSRENYLHAEFRSRVFGFVDDFEALIDQEQKLIFVRSASRVGHSDLGVNRNRVEEIRQRYLKP